MQERSLATLQGLLEASRSDVSPQDTLAELMDLGNRELRGENYAAKQAAAEQAAENQAAAPPSHAAEATEDHAVTGLSMEDLARLLEASHAADPPSEAPRTTEEDL